MAASIRAYADQDREAVRALIADVLAEHGFTLNMGGLEGDLAHAHARYTGGRAGFWVAEEGGVIVGTVAIRPKDEAPTNQAGARGPSPTANAPGTCEVKRLYLRADARGKGLGQALYAHAEAFAVGAGYQRIWLDSSRRFKRARSLYERNGFVLVEELANDWEDNTYEKRLA